MNLDETMKRPVLKWEGDYISGSYITFVHTGNSKTGKTMVFQVRAEDGSSLGAVSWFGRWRCYAFNPEFETVYEKTCLREIAEFCEELTKEHKERTKARASASKAPAQAAQEEASP